MVTAARCSRRCCSRVCCARTSRSCVQSIVTALCCISHTPSVLVKPSAMQRFQSERLSHTTMRTTQRMAKHRSVNRHDKIQIKDRANASKIRKQLLSQNTTTTNSNSNLKVGGYHRCKREEKHDVKNNVSSKFSFRQESKRSVPGQALPQHRHISGKQLNVLLCPSCTDLSAYRRTPNVRAPRIVSSPRSLNDHRGLFHDRRVVESSVRTHRCCGIMACIGRP